MRIKKGDIIMIRKTKIVCTIGPATESVEMLEKMLEAGMNVARLNFSHGDYEESSRRLTNIRTASKNINKPVSILLDTKGPEIRTGIFENGGCMFNKGDKVTIKREDIIGTKESFTLLCKEVFDDISTGDTILIDDGKMNLKVLSHDKNNIHCLVNNTGMIKSKKGCNIPNVKLSMPFLSEKDLNDIMFGIKNNFDIIALSFVRRAEDVQVVRSLINSYGKNKIEIIAKIENQEGYDNVEEILKVADGIMVARGDLGVEVSSELVPLYQKNMIKIANRMGKLVITATHMLESMISCPRPTRAEASDVANAIFDGSTAVMLSGESAVGEYPLEAVGVLNRISQNVEANLDYNAILSEIRKDSLRTINEAVGVSVCQCASSLDGVAAIVAFTETGGTAKRISKFKPCVPIIACTDSADTFNKINLYWGVYPVMCEYITDFNMYDVVASNAAKSVGVKVGEKIIITSGYLEEHGTTNTIRIIEVR